MYLPSSINRCAKPSAACSPRVLTCLRDHKIDDVQASDATKQLPVFVGHGSADPLVPATLATRTVDGLKASGSVSNGACHANRCHGWPGQIDAFEHHSCQVCRCCCRDEERRVSHVPRTGAHDQPAGARRPEDVSAEGDPSKTAQPVRLPSPFHRMRGACNTGRRILLHSQ